MANALRRKLNKISNIVEKVLCYNLVFIITPCFFIFEMTVVRPVIVTNYNMGACKHILHIICSSFCFVNIVGNMMFSIITDTTVNMATGQENYCELCKISRPAKAWHCKTCNVCVLKRDHHCFFFSRCIGLRNQRYYVLYLFYLLISMIYSLYYNYYYILTKFGDANMLLSAFRVVNPFLRYLIPEPMDVRDLYMFFLVLNTGLLIWTVVLFYFHIVNVLRGLTAYESSKDEFGADWDMVKKNFVNVFGVKWYWAILCPFTDSPLPEDVELKYR